MECICKEAVVATNKNHKAPQSGYPVFCSRYEHRISRIWSIVLSLQTLWSNDFMVAGFARNQFIRVLLNFRVFIQLHMVFTTEWDKTPTWPSRGFFPKQPRICIGNPRKKTSIRTCMHSATNSKDTANT